MGKQLHVGLVGCGLWGRYILRDLVSLGCAVHVVARSNRSKQFASEFGAAKVYEHHDQIPTVDGIVIATTSVSHAGLALSLIDRHVPILVEKPLTTDVESAREIISRAADRVFVMHKWRFHSGVEKLAEIARAGDIGDISGMRLVQVGWGNPHDDIGVVWHLAPHVLSIAWAILGYLPSPRYSVLDILPRGLVAGMVATLGGQALQPEPWVVLEVSQRFPQKTRDFRVFGSEGVAILGDAYADHIQIFRHSHGSEVHSPEHQPISSEMPLFRELEEFACYLRGGPQPRCSAREGLEVVETIDALLRLGSLNDREAA